MRFFRSSPIGTAAAILLIVAVVVAIFAGQVAPYDPLYNDYACGAIAQIQHLPHLRELCPAARARDAHTQWDREGGTRLPYRYGVSTRAERQARSSPRQSAEVLLERHVQACVALADSARENAAAH